MNNIDRETHKDCQKALEDESTDLAKNIPENGQTHFRFWHDLGIPKCEDKDRLNQHGRKV